ncbi:hypothetical protein [Alkalicoccobacillus murimartini]|uniref:Uncharacterized protein n=1 Tax=Alkalicoccobacillus murimartini TaxID=171685 RepID=A0ABT9YFF0_9BACI|nr:hypothetical protein [Alkalicoccobacillus murimartini]MDQ0206552.1 hypothetical protein [Alkalicoccobacillus murimartini]
MKGICRLIICCSIMFFCFWLFDFTSQLTLFTVIICSIVSGYWMNMVLELYSKFKVVNR